MIYLTLILVILPVTLIPYLHQRYLTLILVGILVTLIVYIHQRYLTLILVTTLVTLIPYLHQRYLTLILVAILVTLIVYPHQRYLTLILVVWLPGVQQPNESNQLHVSFHLPMYMYVWAGAVGRCELKSSTHDVHKCRCFAFVLYSKVPWANGSLGGDLSTRHQLPLREHRQEANVSHGEPVYPHSFHWYSLCLPTKGWPGWVDLGGWLHTEAVFASADHHRFNSNRARRKVTLLIEDSVLPTSQTAAQPVHYKSGVTMPIYIILIHTRQEIISYWC